MSTHQISNPDLGRATGGRRAGRSLDRRPAGAASPSRAPVDPLTAAVVLAAAVATIAGLLVDGVYASGRHGTGAEATAAMLRGFDLVTVAVALPALLWASTGVRRTTLPGRLTAAAILAYLGYTYAYHLLGNGFTDLLLLHLAVLAGSVLALVRMLRTLSGLGSGTPLSATAGLSRSAARGAAITLGALATALGGMWVSACLVYAVTRNLPEGSLLVETDQVVQLGIVLDLAVLVPLYGTAATLLWRGRWWGAVLGALALVAGLLHQVSYLVALAFQDLAGVPGAVPFDPFEPVIVALYVAGAVLLFRALGRSGPVMTGPEAQP